MTGPAAVRVRVTALATAALAVVLAIAGATLVIVQRAALIEDVDDSARAVAASAAAQTAAGTAPAQPIQVAGDDDTAVQVVADGSVLAATANIAGEAPLTRLTEGAETLDTAPHAEGRFRVLASNIDTADGPAQLIVAIALDDVDASIAALIRSLLLTGPVALAALAGVVWWVVGRTLRPVEAANRRQQRFVADASHELRAPLARMRSELEVDLAHSDGSDPWRTHRSVLDEIEWLQRLVDDLLQLARMDASAEPQLSVVDLDDLVLAEAERVRVDGSVRVDLSELSAAQLQGDPDGLTRAVRNLADNAARHARTTVAFGVAESNGHAVLTVTDDGPGIPQSEADRVFERFAQLDPSRTGSGVGLGLAIAREIVTRHGGTIVVDQEYDAGARLVVTLPTSAGQGRLQLQ
jgi:signal transduction histidine kinase